MPEEATSRSGRGPIRSDDKDLVVIVGASGNQGRALIPLLYKNPSFNLGLVCNGSKSFDRFGESYPSANVMQAELTYPEECEKAVAKATTVFYLDAALVEKKNGRLRHFVFSGVLRSQLRKLLHHDCKRYVEEYLMESGLNYTILQPTTFMDNVPVSLIAKQDNPTFPAMWNFELAFSFLALKDLGEAAAKVIMEGEKHYFAEYPLASTPPITYNVLLDEIGKQIGKKVNVVTKSLEEATEMLCRILFGDTLELETATREAAEHMILYYNRHGLKANSNVLEWILGRKATGYKEWVTMQISGGSGE